VSLREDSLKYLLSLLLIVFLFSCASQKELVNHNVSLDKFHKSCRVKLLENGRESLLHRIQLIRNAKESIELQTFIWTDDECGRILLNELALAAQRGVKVRIICDHLFSSQDAIGLAAISLIKNLEIKIYNPAGDRIKPAALDLMIESIGNFHKVNQRMHNKLFLVDGKQGICGGRNIENTYYDNSIGLNFKDLDVAIQGPVTVDMKKSFEKFWESPISIPLTSLKDVAEKVEEKPKLNLQLSENLLHKNLPELLASYKWEEDYFEVNKMAFFSDEPGKNDTNSFSGSSHLNDFIIKVLSQAEDRIWIQSPYLVLSSKAKKNFKAIRKAKPKLDIKISTNSLAATDSWPTYAFLYKQKKTLINDLGIEIYEFNPLPGDLMEILPNYSDLLKQKAGLTSLPEKEWQEGDVNKYPRICLHSKCMLVDDRIAFVGSYNLDPRSANLNTELSAVIIDKKFNEKLAKYIKADVAAKNSWVVAKRRSILGVKQIYELIAAVTDLGVEITGIDLWPRRFTSCYQLKPGAKEVHQSHKNFYENYYSVGNFPRVPFLGEKEILARFFKAFGIALKPIL